VADEYNIIMEHRFNIRTWEIQSAREKPVPGPVETDNTIKVCKYFKVKGKDNPVHAMNE
jgi:hypothetical protein